MDKIIIENLRARCIIGVFPNERKRKQDIVLNITLYTDIKQAVKNDDLNATVDYKALRDEILSYVEGTTFNLIETLADRVASLCLQKERVSSVSVKVDKPGALTFAENVSVVVDRNE